MDILFEDEHCLAVSKPAMLSTQAPPIAGETLEPQVRAYLSPGPGIRVRRDRAPAGPAGLGRRPLGQDAARRASPLQAVRARQVEKIYWALVEAGPGQPDEAGRWEDWLVREETGLGRVQRCVTGTPRSQRAVTCFVLRELATSMDWTWLELRPETGRMHQLRVQTAERGWPILGDTLYGSKVAFPVGIALHARSLTFGIPRSGPR